MCVALREGTALSLDRHTTLQTHAVARQRSSGGGKAGGEEAKQNKGAEEYGRAKSEN